MSNALFKTWLTLDLAPRIAQLERNLLAELQQAFDKVERPIQGREPIREQGLYFVDFIKQLIKQELADIQTLRQHYYRFNQLISHSATEEERREQILRFAKELGASERQLAGDRAAFKRWFGQEVVIERYQRRLVETERKLAFYLKRLGSWSHQLLTQCSDDKQLLLWRQLDLEALIKPLLAYEGDSRVRIAAFHCLAKAIKGLPSSLQEQTVTEGTLQYVFRSTLESHRETWIQTEALTLLASLSPSYLQTVLQRRLGKPLEGDDLFVRCRCVQLLCQHLGNSDALTQLLTTVCHDPSSAVRQRLAEQLLTKASPENAAVLLSTLQQLALEDSSPQVRSMALLQLSQLIDNTENRQHATELLNHSLQHDQDEFVLRVALKMVDELHFELMGQDTDAATAWRSAILPAVEQLHQSADSLSVRRWAAQARERVWLHATPQRSQLTQQLQQYTQAMPPGKRRRFNKALLDDADQQTVGRVLSGLAQQDYGFDLAPGKWRPHLTRGHRFGFRSWRLWHELRRSSTDKRQGFSHTIGRIFNGTLRAPSAILSELAETKVPGEPLHVSDESGWRPYLPLVDEVISCIDEGMTATTISFYSSEGITELTPPSSFARRLKARTLLTARFAHYAELRNWKEGDQASPDSYLQALCKLGFRVAFRRYPTEETFEPSSDPSVQRFFPAAIPFFDLESQTRLQDYFFSVYENSLTDLAIFLAGMSAVFATRHLYVNHQLRRARANLPLVVGGWGTRGKSGTERLKAALFNGLGYGVVSKTTGCEAMFLHAPAYGKLREMFLFRPYDKATIWEQGDVMRLAEQLGVEVFLWECMALTPSYVSVLQQEWVRDDIATITNTYPDHEDLQGPAGVNIPQVMTNFVPKQSVLLTSEEQMLPILRSEAEKKACRMTSVGWLEAGLLPEDILSRFPYEEHPYNIALVLAMADELEVDHDFALKEMADRVVADLGVLKAYPIAELQQRKLEFVMGMSANERFGCLNNWQRMGFSDQDWQQQPGVWLTTVVNNRADRVARSQVFASILVNDLSADRHFLIGTNLEGLLGYINEEWAHYIRDISLWPKGSDNPQLVLQKMVKYMRIPHHAEHVINRLRIMLEAFDIEDPEPLLTQWQQPDALDEALQQAEIPDIEQLLSQHQAYLQRYQQYQAFAEQLVTLSGPDSAVDKQFHQLMWQWFSDKLVVIEDPHALGDEIIQTICNETPPGIHNRIMGMQNIKGTGLDYVYRWQAWESCHQACCALFSEDSHEVKQALLSLMSFKEYGVLSESFVRNSVEQAHHLPTMQNESHQAELQVILSNLDSTMKKHSGTGNNNPTTSPFISSIINSLEAFLDAGDAIKRRKHANRVYRDLTNQRISHERAAIELQDLNKRQKGGWFVRYVQSMNKQNNSK